MIFPGRHNSSLVSYQKTQRPTCGWDKVAATSVLPLLAVKKSCDTAGRAGCDSGSAERGAANSKPLPNLGASDDCDRRPAASVSKKLRSDL